MAGQTFKRMRSQEDSNNCKQFKVFVNELMVVRNDERKMRQIYENTRTKLLEGARKLNAFTMPSEKLPLFKQFQLSGDGTIVVREVDWEDETAAFAEQRSKCCSRMSYLHDECVNCTMALCEECGYSCKECQRFICRACVTVFGNSVGETPLCEACQMLFA